MDLSTLLSGPRVPTIGDLAAREDTNPVLNDLYLRDVARRSRQEPSAFRRAMPNLAEFKDRALGLLASGPFLPGPKTMPRFRGQHPNETPTTEQARTFSGGVEEGELAALLQHSKLDLQEVGRRAGGPVARQITKTRTPEEIERFALGRLQAQRARQAEPPEPPAPRPVPVKAQRAREFWAENEAKLREMHAAGKRDAEIGEALGISPKTVYAKRAQLGLETIGYTPGIYRRQPEDPQ